MDFKDLALFIDALLAKQAWRLLHHKDSLFYRVFKSKFFLDCSVMEASENSLSSYAWNSILKGSDVLLKRARWRVGCGESINVWSESPIVAGFEDLKVLDLIDPVSRTWDSNLIHGLFIPQEANMIMSIPLCQSFAEDKLIWPFSPSGIYTEIRLKVSGKRK